MTVHPVKFGRGMGLQARSSQVTQRKLIEHTNVAVGEDGIVRKATGHDLVSLVRSSDPTDAIPADDTRAIWHRGPELVLETQSELYSRQVCADGATGGTTAGTATPPEISDALDAIDVRADTSRTIDITLPGDLNAAQLRTRASRDTTTVSATMDITLPAVRPVITMTIAPDSGTNKLRWTATEGAATATGLMTRGTQQRVPGIQDMVALVGQSRQEFVVTYIAGNGANAELVAETMTINSPNLPTFDQSTQVLAIVRGAPSEAWQTSHTRAITAFKADGKLSVWDITDFSVTDFSVVNPPPAGSAYSMDHFTALFPFGEVGVTWLSEGDNIHRVADVVPALQAEAEYPGVRSGSDRVVAINTGAGGTKWLIGWKQATTLVIPVLGWDITEPYVRVVDLDGSQLRLGTATAGGKVTYQMRRTLTGELYSNTLTMGTPELTAVTDSHFVERDDLVVGAIISAGKLHQLSWDRTFDTPTSEIATTDAAGLAVSANRWVFAYWSNSTTLVIRVLDSYDDASPVVTGQVVPQVYTLGNPVACSVEAEKGAGDAVVRVHSWLDDTTVYSASLASDIAVVTDEFVNTFLTKPPFAVGTSAGAAPRAMLAVEYDSGSREVWEVDTDLFVRVSPPVAVLAGGDWAARGPWTRLNARQRVVREHGQNVLNCDAAAIINDQGRLCTIVVSEVATKGALADVVSTHTESRSTIDGTGRRPRVAPYGDDRAIVAYELATREVVYAVWSPGSALSFATTGSTLQPARVWDWTGGSTSATPYWILLAEDAPGQARIRVVPETGSPAAFTLPSGLVTEIDFAVHALVEDSDTLLVGWAIAGFGVFDPEVMVGTHRVTLSTGSAVQLWTHTIDPGPDPVAVGVAVQDAATNNVWLEVDEGTNHRVFVYDFDDTSSTLLRKELRCALATQLATMAGQSVGVLTLLGGEFEETKTLRSALVAKAHATGEIVGRLGLGLVENAVERAQRNAHTGLNVQPGGGVAMGWQWASVDPDTDIATTTATLSWCSPLGPHEPAVIDAITIAAHGGYPRMYDGQAVVEHDWHELPEISGAPIVVGGAGALEAGEYLFAITWTWTDVTGQRYRSAPTFWPRVTVAATDAVNLTWFTLTQTERVNVRAELWRSIADVSDDELYLEKHDVPVDVNDVRLTSMGLALTDDELQKREMLDQRFRAGGVLFSTPSAVTDFTAAVNSRVWSRDPAAEQRARYTIPSRDLGLGAAFGLHWNDALITRHNGPGELRAISEMDGRIVLWTDTSASVMSGDGPDLTGAGAYAVPALLSVDIGVGSQSAIASTADGLVYGAPAQSLVCGFGQPPRLLTRGLTTFRLGEDVEYAYNAGARADVVVFAESTGDVLFGDTQGELMYRWNRDTQKWHTSDRWVTRDMSVSPTGRVVILTADGRVLLECGNRHDDGGIGYIWRVHTPWVHAVPGSPWGAGNLSIVQVTGSMANDAALNLEVFIDYETAPRESLQVTATIAQHIWEYRGGIPMHAASIAITDSGELFETLRLEAVLLDIASEGSAVLDQTPDDQAFQVPE